MSVKALQDYTVYSRYAKYIPEKKRRETWKETVDRVFQMHEEKYADFISTNEKLKEYILFAKQLMKQKRVLGSQRALQFAGAPIFKHEAKIYNCAFGHISRARAFQEVMYLLLCGCGVGFSVQKQHVQQLPSLTNIDTNNDIVFVVEDSIEGWSDAIGVLVNSYFESPSDEFKQYSGKYVIFDYTQIRPEGALIAGGFKAPGPKGLARSIEKIREVLNARIASNINEGEFANKLRPIDAYDIIMHSSDAVLSGGVRRSATLSLFSVDDVEMINAKTGDWFIKNPQRGRSNNSAALIRNTTTRDQFARLMASAKEFGEPGFIWLDDPDIGFNPCVEIGLYPIAPNGIPGFQFCNLATQNASKCRTEEEFYEACKASAIIGTLQAGYTKFKYLTKETREITEREALLGCSMTGMMENPDIVLNPDIQRKGAELIKQINSEVAAMININPAARCCALKPEGSASALLGTCSGIHPHHSKRYIRHVQANKNEFPVQHVFNINPIAVQESVWSNNKTDYVISFLCEVPKGSIVKNQLSAVELLSKVKLTQQNWVEYGTRVENCVKPYIRHNVSNTITIKDDEWSDVEQYIWDNKQWFAGISLLPFSGDLNYPQAPFTSVLTPTEIVEEYGDGSVFASGIIVDGINCFNSDLWKACDALLNRGHIPVNDYKQNTHKESYNIAKDVFECQAAWINRAIKFGDKYFNGNYIKVTHCLKHVYVWKTWCDLKREYVEIDWSEVVEEQNYSIDVTTLGAQACAGGKCELI